MKKRRLKPKSPRVAKAEKPTAIVWSESRTVVLIDGSKVRDSMLKKFRATERKLEQARAQITSFQTTDCPAYHQWQAEKFGALLTKIRELQAEIQQKETLLCELESEMMHSKCSRAVAYKRVMDRRGDPEAYAEWQRKQREARESADPFNPFDPFEDFREAQNFDDDDQDEEEQSRFNAVTDNFDIDEYDQWSKREKAAFRREWEEVSMMGRFLFGRSLPDFDSFLQSKRDGKRSPSEEPTAESPPPPPDDPAKRFKALYRKLVRMLHPDGNSNHGPVELALWHDVQIAYESGQLERLEAVEARYELSIAGHSDAVPVGTIQSAIQDIQTAIKNLNREYAGLKKHPAWNFTNLKPTKITALERRERNHLDYQISELNEQLYYLRHALADFAKKPIKRTPKKKVKKPTAKSAKPSKPSKPAPPPKPNQKSSDSKIPDFDQMDLF